jgi:vacuolar-type H+-ATPase subunit I/STV1
MIFSQAKAQDIIPFVLCNFVDWVKNILLIIGILAVILAGYQIMSAAGDPSKMESAKRLLVVVIVGMALISLFGTFITNIGLQNPCGNQ